MNDDLWDSTKAARPPKPTLFEHLVVRLDLVERECGLIQERLYELLAALNRLQGRLDRIEAAAMCSPPSPEDPST